MKLRGAHLDRHRREVLARPGVGRQRPLHQAEVALPHRRHAPVVPRLGAQPAQRRRAVGTLVERRELTAGTERATHALHDDLKAALGHQPPEDEPGELPATVGGAHEHGRLRRCGAVGGHPAIGEQPHAVVHVDRQVAVVMQLGGARRDEAHPPREQP